MALAFNRATQQLLTQRTLRYIVHNTYVLGLPAVG